MPDLDERDLGKVRHKSMFQALTGGRINCDQGNLVQTS